MLQNKVSIALRTTIFCVALSASLVSLADAATYHRLDASPAGSYRIDPDHSLAWFTIGHAGVAVVVGRFDKLSGSYTFNPASPAGDKADIRIPAASINTNFPL
ncbi:YceI family protein, partial [Acidithiobacillus ferriphilus]